VDSTDSEETEQARNDFIEQSQTSSQGLVREMAVMRRSHRNWFLTPLVAVLLLIGLLVLLTSTAAAPIIYTLF
jgi:hypothetical protein